MSNSIFIEFRRSNFNWVKNFLKMLSVVLFVGQILTQPALERADQLSWLKQTSWWWKLRIVVLVVPIFAHLDEHCQGCGRDDGHPNIGTKNRSNVLSFHHQLVCFNHGHWSALSRAGWGRIWPTDLWEILPPVEITTAEFIEDSSVLQFIFIAFSLSKPKDFTRFI